jgi:hypothetical protein
MIRQLVMIARRCFELKTGGEPGKSQTEPGFVEPCVLG